MTRFELVKGFLNHTNSANVLFRDFFATRLLKEIVYPIIYKPPNGFSHQYLSSKSIETEFNRVRDSDLSQEFKYQAIKEIFYNNEFEKSGTLKLGYGSNTNSYQLRFSNVRKTFTKHNFLNIESDVEFVVCKEFGSTEKLTLEKYLFFDYSIYLQVDTVDQYLYNMSQMMKLQYNVYKVWS